MKRFCVKFLCEWFVAFDTGAFGSLPVVERFRISYGSGTDDVGAGRGEIPFEDRVE
jgi:hypothetical protein